MDDCSFALLAGVNTVAATPAEESIKNIPVNLARGFPRLHQMPEFQRIKGAEVPIALVGGGPSLAKTVGELKSFRHIMACGSSHDYLRAQGLAPEYCAICDPDPIVANYLRNPSTETKYLLSSHCADAVFEALKGMSICLWHCAPIEKEFLDQHDPGWHAVGGGCTIGLRALSLSIVLGYENLHLFGYDSCLGETDDEHHAYKFSGDTEELGEIYTVKIGLGTNGPIENGRTYRCAGYQMAQADHFKIFVQHYGNMFKPTFHGDGLLPEMWEQMLVASEQIQQNQENTES